MNRYRYTLRNCYQVAVRLRSSFSEQCVVHMWPAVRECVTAVEPAHRLLVSTAQITPALPAGHNSAVRMWAAYTTYSIQQTVYTVELAMNLRGVFTVPGEGPY